MDLAISYGLKVNGYQKAREHQEEIIGAYFNGKDAFLCAPTGSGKSFVFELAPFVLHIKAGGKIEDSPSNVDKKVIVISPLVDKNKVFMIENNIFSSK